MQLIIQAEHLSAAERILLLGTTEAPHKIIELSPEEQQAIEHWRVIPAEMRLNMMDFASSLGKAPAEALSPDELAVALAKEGCYDPEWYKE